MRVPWSASLQRFVGFWGPLPIRLFLAAFFFFLAALFLAAAALVLGARVSRAGIAVESRAMCPMRRLACVAAITAWCSWWGNWVRANSANARENFDSWGSFSTLDHPQNWRNASSTRRREMRSLVVGRL